MSRHALTAPGLALAIISAVVVDVSAGTYQADPVHNFPTSIFGLVHGEFDPTHEGPEVAALLRDGAVWQISPNDEWTVHRIGQVPLLYEPLSMSFRSTLAIGDVLGDFPGNELIAHIGGTLTAYGRNPDGTWTAHAVGDVADMFGVGWGARVGDLEPAHPGDEIFYLHEAAGDISSGTIYRENADGWHRETVYLAEVGMDTIIADLSDAPGDELIVVTEMGPTYLLTRPLTGGINLWPSLTLWDDFDNAGWVVAAADVDPQLPGIELVYGTRYNNMIALSTPGAGGVHQFVPLFQGNAFDHPHNIWDIAVAELVGGNDTLEIVGVDNTGSTYVLQQSNGTWSGQTVYGHPTPLNVVVAGRLDADAIPEILVGSQTGELARLTATVNLTGDLNCDGVVSVGDINPFVLALTDPAAYADQFPDCDIASGDINDDGIVSVGDINGFVALITR